MFDHRRRSYRAGERPSWAFEIAVFSAVIVIFAMFGAYVAWPLLEALISWLNRH